MSERPSLIVIAGPNGCGKSTLTEYLQQNFELGYYINPDEIAAQLDGKYEARVREAQSIADQQRDRAIADRRDFSFETVFSDPRKLDVLDRARRVGFEITMFFVCVENPTIAVERVRTRVELHGHNVPIEKTIARYARTLNLLPEIITRTHRSFILDNSQDTHTSFEFDKLLVASTKTDALGRVSVIALPTVPQWTYHHLIEPAYDREWTVQTTLTLLTEEMRIVEAMLFASNEPLNEKILQERMPQGVDVREVLRGLEVYYENRGVNLRRIANKWMIQTAPDLGWLIAGDGHGKKLTRAAIETLAIVAYGQPITRSEIEDIRGVSASKGTLDLLMEIGWIHIAGRRRSPGRPITYKTTDLFLTHFGLASLDDLENFGGMQSYLRAFPTHVEFKASRGDAVVEEENSLDDDLGLFPGPPAND
jgi:segregation and condensation protein B